MRDIRLAGLTHRMDDTSEGTNNVVARVYADTKQWRETESRTVRLYRRNEEEGSN